MVYHLWLRFYCIRNTYLFVCLINKFQFFEQLSGVLFTVLTYIYTPFYCSFATKTEHLSTDKCSVFVYPSRRLGISSDASRYIIKGALRPCISSAPLGLDSPAAWWYTTLRVDDIQCFALMVYTPSAWLGREIAKSSWITLQNMI